MAATTVIELSIEADLCGPISVGTVAIIRALMTHLSLSLPEAVAVVDRCTFGGERVRLPAPSARAAAALLAALRQVPAAARIRASAASRE